METERQREQTKLRVQRYRDKKKSVTSDEIGNAGDVTPDVCVTQDVTPLPPEWAHVREFIRRPSSGMSNLERLQRIAGSLGKGYIKILEYCYRW